jgi:hypothetical protein
MRTCNLEVIESKNRTKPSPELFRFAVLTGGYSLFSALVASGTLFRSVYRTRLIIANSLKTKRWKLSETFNMENLIQHSRRADSVSPRKLWTGSPTTPDRTPCHLSNSTVRGDSPEERLRQRLHSLNLRLSRRSTQQSRETEPYDCSRSAGRI